MLRGEVGLFADFIFQIVEAPALGQIGIALADAHSERLTGQGEFPRALSHSLQLGAAEVMPDVARGLFGFAE